MEFPSLAKIEVPQFYLDKAIQQTTKIISGLKSSSKLRKDRQRIKTVTLKRIDTFTKIITMDLEVIEKAFPTFDNLPLFYQELIDTVIGTVPLKKSISSIGWLRKKIQELSRQKTIEMKKCDTTKGLHTLWKSFLGRVSSMFKKVGKYFIFLDNARKKFRSFPSLKTNIRTIAIAGYPNVGKSTLLGKLTTANPEINIYPFTTKSLMIGYIGKKVQLIDTPGTFREDLRKMNYIERQAYLALKYLCEKIIFVFDLTESCGYSIEQQEKLLIFIQKQFPEKKIILYFSKNDILDLQVLRIFKRKYQSFTTYADAFVLKKVLKK